MIDLRWTLERRLQLESLELFLQQAKELLNARRDALRSPSDQMQFMEQNLQSMFSWAAGLRDGSFMPFLRELAAAGREDASISEDLTLSSLPYPLRLCVSLLHYAAFLSEKTADKTGAQVKASVLEFFDEATLAEALKVLYGPETKL